MFKVGLIGVFMFVFGFTADAQTWKYMRQEFQFGIGGSSFFGDLGGGKGEAKNDFRDFRLSATRPTITLGYKYMISPSVSVKGLISTGLVSGNDASTPNPIRQNRNLSFRSGILGGDLMVEVYPFSEQITRRYKIKGVGGKGAFTLSPYFSLGIGVVAFQPKAELDGTWHNLQPLGTEGQGLAGRPDKYKRYTFTVPMAVGAKYLIDRNWSVGFEVSVRYTGSDYIDDVSTSYFSRDKIEAAYGPVAAALSDRGINPDPTSLGTGVGNLPGGGKNYLQRGDPNFNDAYAFAIFSVHYRIRKGTKFIPKF